MMNKMYSDEQRSNRLRRLLALIRKEFYQIIRDPSSILISIGLPLLLMFLYGFGVSLDINNMRIGVVLEDLSPTARSFGESLAGSPYLNVTQYRTIEEANEDLTASRIRGFAVIPSYFTLFQNMPPQKGPIMVIADGSETNTANFVQNYIQGAWQIWLMEQAFNRGIPFTSLINVQARFWYNETLESRNYLIPGSLALIMTLIGTLLTALVVAREWERGTMEALMSTPVGIVELTLGKLIPYYVLGMSSMTLCVLIAVFFYEIPFQGSFPVLMLLTSIFLFPALGLGLLISTITKNQFTASQAAIVSAFLPAFMLSGFIFEIASMPWPIRMLTLILPARYFVSSLQTIFLVGDIWPLLIANIIPMLLIGTIIFLAIIRITVKRLD